MRLKKLIRYFVPPIFYFIKKKLFSPKLLLAPSLLPQIIRDTEKVVIIGNGPSLNDSVVKYKDEILANDRMCVNYFASSELYELMQMIVALFSGATIPLAFFPDKFVRIVRSIASPEQKISSALFTYLP